MEGELGEIDEGRPRTGNHVSDVRLHKQTILIIKIKANALIYSIATVYLLRNRHRKDLAGFAIHENMNWLSFWLSFGL